MINTALPKIQFKILFDSIISADSFQKIIQLNSQGTIDTVWIGKVPQNCPKSVTNWQERGYSLKMANIVSKYDPFIYFMIEFNSKDYSIYQSFQKYSIQIIIP